MTDTDIPYAFRVSPHARRVSIVIGRDGGVTVSVPRRVNRAAAEAFVRRKSAWIREHVARMKKLPPRIRVPDLEIARHPARARENYLAHRELARTFIAARVAHWNGMYQFPFRAVAVRNQTSRWGSCSREKNLNFNYRLLLIPPYLADYVVVHELCHLNELNHSRAFWHLVGLTIPDFRARRKELRKYRIA